MLRHNNFWNRGLVNLANEIVPLNGTKARETYTASKTRNLLSSYSSTMGIGDRTARRGQDGGATKNNMREQQARAKRREAMVTRAAPRAAVKVKQEFIDMPIRTGKGTAETPVVIDEEERAQTYPKATTTSMGNVRIDNNEGVVGVTNVNGDVYIQTGQEGHLKEQRQGQTRPQLDPKARPRVNFLKEFEAEADAEIEKKYATPTKQKQKPQPPVVRRSVRIQGANKNKQNQSDKEKGARATEIQKPAAQNDVHPKEAEATGAIETNPVSHTTGSERIQTQATYEQTTQEEGNNNQQQQYEEKQKATKVIQQISNQHKEITTKAIEYRDVEKVQKNLQDSGDDRTREATTKTMAQILLTEPTIVKRQQSFRMQFSFVTTGRPNSHITMAKAQASHLHKALTDFLRQAQAIDSTVVLNTWKTAEKYRTIQKTEDVPTELQNIMKFIRPPPGAKLKTGTTNWYWGVLVSADSKMEEFMKVWADERRRMPKAEQPAAIREAPLQSEEWYESGLFIGSTSNQEISVLIKGIQKELNDPTVGIKWQSIVFPGCNKLWAKARARGKEDGPKAKFASAPMAMQVLVDSKAKIRSTLKALYEKYGQVAEDGSWPILPDGSRMRFIPNFQFTKDAMGKKRIERRMQLQVQMHYSNRVFPIPIKDPTRCITVDGRATTIGNLVLEEVCHVVTKEQTVNEPYFRHFVKRWVPDAERRIYDIAVHEHMTKLAKRKIKSLTKDMINKYGDAIKAHLILPKEASIGMSLSSDEGEEEEEAFTLGDSDDDSVDMYMTGKSTTFVFEGLEKVKTTEGPGPGGAQSNIAFTVKSGRTEQDPDGNNDGLVQAREGQQEDRSNINEAQTTNIDPYQEKGWTKVTGHRNKAGNATPHRKTQDPAEAGQMGP